MTNLIKTSFFSLFALSMVTLVSCGGESDEVTYEKRDTSSVNVPVNTAVDPNDSLAAKMRMDSMNRMTNDTSNKMKPGAMKAKKGKASVAMNEPAKSSAAMTAGQDGYYTNVETWPVYPGGQRALENYFADNVDYPDAAEANGTQGTVQVSFGVDENGKVVAPKVISSRVGDGLEDEALRLVKNMPAWTAAKVKGKNVKTRFTLPVRFELTE